MPWPKYYYCAVMMLLIALMQSGPGLVWTWPGVDPWVTQARGWYLHSLCTLPLCLSACPRCWRRLSLRYERR